MKVDMEDIRERTNSFTLYVPATNGVHAENQIRSGNVYRSPDAAESEAVKQTEKTKYRWTIWKIDVREL